MPESLSAIRRRIAAEADGAQQVVRQVAAGVAPKLPPRSVPSSVFNLSQAKRLVQGAQLDPATVVLSDRKPGQYKPERPATGYRALYERMRPGQCAELTDSQAREFARWAKKHGVAVRRERIGPGVTGVWLV